MAVLAQLKKWFLSVFTGADGGVIAEKVPSLPIINPG